MLKSLFNDFLEDLAKDAVKLINKFLVDLMDIALNCQNYISTKHLICLLYTSWSCQRIKFEIRKKKKYI